MSPRQSAQTASPASTAVVEVTNPGFPLASSPRSRAAQATRRRRTLRTLMSPACGWERLLPRSWPYPGQSDPPTCDPARTVAGTPKASSKADAVTASPRDHITRQRLDRLGRFGKCDRAPLRTGGRSCDGHRLTRSRSTRGRCAGTVHPQLPKSRTREVSGTPPTRLDTSVLSDCGTHAVGLHVCRDLRSCRDATALWLAKRPRFARNSGAAPLRLTAKRCVGTWRRLTNRAALALSRVKELVAVGVGLLRRDLRSPKGGLFLWRAVIRGVAWRRWHARVSCRSEEVSAHR